MNKRKYFLNYLVFDYQTATYVIPFQEQQIAYDVLHYKYFISIYKPKIYILGIKFLYIFHIWKLINICKLYPSWLFAIILN